MTDALERGVLLKKRPDGRPISVACEMKRLTVACLGQVMALQELIVSRLSRPEMLQPFSEAFMRTHFGPRGIVLGVFVEKELVAFRNVYFPKADDREWNLAIDLGFPPQALPRVANLQMVCVHPSFRSNGLALKMNRQAIKVIGRLGCIDHLFATVSPYNYWNINILLETGFTIRALKDKYGGKLRYLAYQDVSRPRPTGKNECRIAPLTDFKQQQTLFQSGYSGIRIQRAPHMSTPAGSQQNLSERRRLPDQFEMVFAPSQ